MGPFDLPDRESASNWLARVRYDRYFLEKNTAYASLQTSGDIYAGILYRIEPQLGYARLFWKSVHQELRGELGVDYIYERYYQPQKPMTTGCLSPGPVEACLISGRLFLFYENKFTPYASFSEGLEYLQPFNRPDFLRLSSITSLSSTISKRVALKLSFTLKYNNHPPDRPAPNADALGNPIPFERVDTILEAVLAVTLL
jgi:hypothetical protein